MRTGSFVSIVCAAALVVAVMPNCSRYPVSPDGGTVLELETVWQYLRVYCIWQDSIPVAPDPFVFSSPEQLFASINDTLHGISYTKYDSTHLPLSMQVAAVSAAAPDTTIYVFPLTDSTVLLQITEFKDDTTYPAFVNALHVIAAYPKIIIDLRGNGGGSINAVDSIIEYFLPVNTAFIKARYREYDDAARTAATVDWENWTTKHSHTPSLVNAQLAVLVNGGTASAAELLTAGLKDGRAAQGGADTATLVGETTYGKGMGQIIISRTYLDKRDIMITFLRLQGVSARIGVYHRRGIFPDLQVVNPGPRVDAQLDSALQILEPSARVLPLAVPAAKLVSTDAGAYIRVLANQEFKK